MSNSGERYLTTYLPDGASVVAVPDPDDDVYAFLHDVVHLIVAKALDLPGSPALARVAHRDASLASDNLVAYEEAAVLAVIEYARALATEVA